MNREDSAAALLRMLNEAAIHFESFPGGRDSDGMSLLYRAIETLKREGCVHAIGKAEPRRQMHSCDDPECVVCGTPGCQSDFPRENSQT